MPTPIRVLVVEDSADDAELVLLTLRRAGYEPAWERVESVGALRAALAALAAGAWDVVLTDHTLPGFDAPEALRLAGEHDPDLPVIVVSGTIGEALAVEMMRAGATDYVLKSDLARLAPAVEREVRDAEHRRGRRRAEAAVRAAERLLRAVTDQTPVLRAEIDTDRRYTFVNRPYAARFGLTPAEVVGRAVPDVLGEEAYRAFAPHVDAALAGARVEFEAELPYPGVGTQVVHCAYEPQLDGAGRVAGFVTAITNVTEWRRAEERLRTTEARFRAVIERGFEAVVLLDATGAIRYGSPAVERVAGRPPAAWLGRDMTSWTHPDDLPAVSDQFRRVLDRPGASGTLVSRFRHGDGAWRWVEATHTNLLADPDVGAVVVNFRDVTDRVRTEEALRASEEEHRTTLDAIPKIVWATNPDGTNVFVNRRWREYTGQRPDDLLGPGWEQAVHPDDRPGVHDLWAATVRGEAVYDVEYRLRRHDGAYRWFLARATARRDEGGRVVRWYGTCTDIHDLKLAQTGRDAARARLSLQVERLPLAYLLSDADFRFTGWNPAAERTFGFTRAEVLGRHPFDLIVPAQSRPLVSDIFRRLAAGDMDAHGACESVTKDGRTITCEWYNTPLFGPDGAFQGVLSLAQDVTARRVLEEQFRQAQKMEAVGRLAGGVAHDFNNLLTIINGYSDILLQKLPPDDADRELLAEIHGAGERAAGLTRQLLAFSRQTVLEPRVLDPNALVRDLVKLLRRLIGEDIDLAAGLAPGVGRVRADPGQLEQALVNLCVNARDAMPQGGKLMVETADAELDAAYAAAYPDVRPGPYVLVAVSDTGVGMTPEVRARVFEPFFTTKEPGKGTGLGLAMVFGFARQSGGHVAVYSEPGRGSTFELYLPRVEAAVAAPGSGVRAEPLPRGTETVLLVEDEPAVRALGRHVLRMCGYTVLDAADGREAARVAAAHGGPIGLLVTDVVMPGGLGGRQVAEAFLARHPGAAVLFTSGYTDDAVVRHGVLDAGVNFLQKPFTPAALAQKVRDVLDDVGSRVGSG